MLLTYASDEPGSLATAIQCICKEGVEVRRREANAWEWVRRLTWDEVAAAEWEEMSQIIGEGESRAHENRN